MLYLLTPGGLRWSDVPGRSTLEAARKYGADLSPLDWQPAESATVGELLPVALRFGVACSAGIVLNGTDAVPATQVRRLEESHAAAAVAHSNTAATSQAIDRMLGTPGVSQELTRRVDEEHVRNVQEAHDEAREQLAARDVDPSLYEHWRGLGGTPLLS